MIAPALRGPDQNASAVAPLLDDLRATKDILIAAPSGGALLLRRELRQPFGQAAS
jgi:hypothetical protein